MTAPRLLRAARTAAIATLVLAGALTLATAASARSQPSRAAKPPAVVAPPPAPPEPADPWQAARALADSARYDDALALIRDALARDGDDFGLRWLQAGITGEAGRHREAVDLYVLLATDHPDRAAELLTDLAGERIEAGDPAGAVRDARRRLAAHPGEPATRRVLALALARSDSLVPALAEYDSLLAADPADVSLALDRARVLAWAGRNGDAIAAYRAVLARDPGNGDAQLGLAMNENWTGRHRAATRELEAIVRRPGADPDAVKALAFARYWDGDADGARAELANYLRLAPGDPEALQLARTLERENAPQLRAEAGRSDDSDGLRVDGTGMQLSWPLARATSARVGWHRDNVRDADGTQDPLRLSAGLTRGFGPAWSLHADLSGRQWGEGTGTRVGGEVGLVSRPVDRVRLEGVVARAPVMTRRSLELGISLLEWIGAADVGLTEALSLHADGHAGFYSDGNGLERLGAAARWRAWASPHAEWALRLSAAQLETHTDPGNGYYAPAWYQEWGPGVEVEWRPRKEWTFGATGNTGWQHERGDLARAFQSMEGRVEYTPVPRWSFDLSGGRSDSNLESATGYRRAWWLAGVTLAF